MSLSWAVAYQLFVDLSRIGRSDIQGYRQKYLGATRTLCNEAMSRTQGRRSDNRPFLQNKGIVGYLLWRASMILFCFPTFIGQSFAKRLKVMLWLDICVWESISPFVIKG